MAIQELSDEQRRQLVDATQAFEAWHASEREFRHAYRGSMHWRTSKGKQYLGRKYGQRWESLGARTADTEKVKDDYTTARTRLKRRIRDLGARLEAMAPVNRALRLGRLPTTPAKVLRKLDEAGILGKQLIVVGTNSLYAYEARSGVLFDGDITATTDIDLLVDARQRMSLAIAEGVRPEGIIGLLRKADTSFDRVNHYRAANRDGYLVDLIAPMAPDEVSASDVRLSEQNDDLVAATIIGLQWLMNAPRFEAVVIAGDGLPAWMPCIDPRAFALHKWWVSKQESREALKRRRDAGQAIAVADVAARFLNLPFEAKALTSLPLLLVQSAKDLVGKSAGKRGRRK